MLSAGLYKAIPFFFIRIQCCQPNQHAAQHAARQAADLTAISAFCHVKYQLSEARNPLWYFSGLLHFQA